MIWVVFLFIILDFIGYDRFMIEIIFKMENSKAYQIIMTNYRSFLFEIHVNLEIKLEIFRGW